MNATRGLRTSSHKLGEQKGERDFQHPACTNCLKITLLVFPLLPPLVIGYSPNKGSKVTEAAKLRSHDSRYGSRPNLSASIASLKRCFTKDSSAEETPKEVKEKTGDKGRNVIRENCSTLKGKSEKIYMEQHGCIKMRYDPGIDDPIVLPITRLSERKISNYAS
ncbi:hypothetical protein C922_05003 [Plasmodium inui San Antonio 1]|uniref:Uncharacterized protein n=1 Tax=Plasmodium inui San Antonio 1 TaxID=1237626 RepID=W6ZZ72_9APIC|nr:hypothetical protein C922_05003 [Plasmodium inui San Antonio 1]EUD64588.1 hypothetical protein C922_05003 [Plasmodium inui San Antonio 1]